MARALLILRNKDIRQKAINWVLKAPEGTRLQFNGPKRSLAQNDRLWSALTDIATQAAHNGKRYDTVTWKCLFLQALGKEVEYIPNLSGTGVVPIGQSSSDLDKEEFSDLLALIESWGADNGIVFHYKDRAA